MLRNDLDTLGHRLADFRIERRAATSVASTRRPVSVRRSALGHVEPECSFGLRLSH
jgi:hypothetical protein